MEDLGTNLVAGRFALRTCLVTEPSMGIFALSAATAQRPGQRASLWERARLNQLVDEMIEHYVNWREECAVVTSSYESWSGAERRDKTLAFSVYVAALDREELAAASYRRLIEQIQQV